MSSLICDMESLVGDDTSCYLF